MKQRTQMIIGALMCLAPIWALFCWLAYLAGFETPIGGLGAVIAFHLFMSWIGIGSWLIAKH